MNSQTETRLPWGNDPITITGRNAGTQALTVHFDNETLNIIDFLNTSLNAEYASLYEEIMSRYGAKLKSGTLFDHGFPETALTSQKLSPCQTTATPADDKSVIDTLLKEYNTYLAQIKEYFREYEKEVERWYVGLLK
jgi:adenylate kinase family enzyme